MQKYMGRFKIKISYKQKKSLLINYKSNLKVIVLNKIINTYFY